MTTNRIIDADRQERPSWAYAVVLGFFLLMLLISSLSDKDDDSGGGTKSGSLSAAECRILADEFDEAMWQAEAATGTPRFTGAIGKADSADGRARDGGCYDH